MTISKIKVSLFAYKSALSKYAINTLSLFSHFGMSGHLCLPVEL